ncbi:FAD-binding oxidoreductase [Bacillus stercoris]|uniref:FAD-binding oxidoreductase n=1 Tax=Bacillus stercoris TaxID=2054641 RepID=UPI0025735EBE|nr:FAD-binding oxidoreductase [Bacillus stercoris]MDL9995116.1 FAD-binding oxidoreductase [Bacillus stercoris]
MEKTKLTGRIVTRDDPDYNEARTNINLSLERYPDIIVFCQNKKDALNALKWARENRVPFRIRGGRHSYENFSLLNNGLVIDLSEMKKITVNQDKKLAYIEAGAELGEVYRTLWQYGLTLPAGSIANVGLTGLTLGGGIGLLTRAAGLTCDRLVNLEMIIADEKEGADLVTVSSSNHPDLFWASQGGGGGNFGIVTSMTFKAVPISQVSIFSITWGWDDFKEVFNTWQHWAPYTDDRLTSSIEFWPKEVNRIEALGQFVGPKTELKKLLKPLLKAGSPTSGMVIAMPFIEAVTFFNSPGGNQPQKMKRSGSFIEKPLSERAILTIKHFLEHAPNQNASIWQQSLGGAAGRIAPDQTAFYYRDAIIAQEYLTNWTSPEEKRQNVRWIERLRTSLSRETMGDYVNWPDIEIRNWPRTYYGENVERLRRVKTKYDPENVFRFEQSIPPLRRSLFF